MKFCTLIVTTCESSIRIFQRISTKNISPTKFSRYFKNSSRKSFKDSSGDSSIDSSEFLRSDWLGIFFRNYFKDSCRQYYVQRFLLKLLQGRHQKRIFFQDSLRNSFNAGFFISKIFPGFLGLLPVLQY